MLQMTRKSYYGLLRNPFVFHKMHSLKPLKKQQNYVYFSQYLHENVLAWSKEQFYVVFFRGCRKLEKAQIVIVDDVALWNWCLVFSVK